jgi:hypothetical protein
MLTCRYGILQQGKGKGSRYYHYGYGVTGDYGDNDAYSKRAYRGFFGSGKGGGKGRHHYRDDEYGKDDDSYGSHQLRGHSKGNSKGKRKGKGDYH